MFNGNTALEIAETEKDLRMGKLLGYMERESLKKVDISKLIGIAESTFSRWFNGDYPNTSRIDAKIDELLEKAERRKEVEKVDAIGFAETEISKAVWWVLEYCQAQKSPGCVYGDAGIGKTYTINEWSRGRSDVILLTAAPAVKSMKAFLKRLAKKLKANVSGTLDDIYAGVEEKLGGGDVMVIIDEAQHLSYATTENIRILGDTTNTAIVFVGNEMVNTRLLGRQSAEFAQVFSRLYMKQHLQTERFCLEDIRKVFGGIEDKAGEFLLQVARSKYGLRGAVILYTNSRNNSDTSEKGLKAMAKTMGILF